MRSWSNSFKIARWAVVPAVLSVPVFGQACSATAPAGETAHQRADAVVIDFYTGADRSAECSGTLLAQNIVLTAAHCADGSNSARVLAPNADGQVAEVSRVFVNDWVSSDPNMDRTVRNDLAILVLRHPIQLKKYARIQKNTCKGCDVVQMGRPIGETGSKPNPVTHVSTNTPAGHPLDHYSPQGLGDSGGGVYRLDGDSLVNLVGITVGIGERTRGGYIAPLNNPAIQVWIRSIVRLASRPAPGAANSPQSHPMDDDYTGDNTGSLDDTTSGDYTDPIDNTNTDNTNTDNTTTDDTTTTEDGTGGQGGAGGEETGGAGGEETGGAGGEETGGAGGEETGGSAGETTTGGSAGEGATGGSAGESSTGGSATGGTGGTNKEDAPKKPEKVDETGKKTGSPSGSPSGSPTSSATTKPSGSPTGSSKPPPMPSIPTSPPQQPQPPPQPYAPPKIIYAPNGAVGKWVAVNGYVAALATDKGFASLPQYAGLITVLGAGVYSSHGAPQTLNAPHDPAIPVSLLTNGRPLVMAVSFSAAPGPSSGVSTVTLFAQEGSGDPAKVYGCTSYVFKFSDMIGCSGGWITGAGVEVPSDVRHNLKLAICKPTITPSGQQTAKESDCVVP